MHDNKVHSQQPAQQQTERNETLDSPGSRVADYGNPTGGAADGENVEQQRNSDTRPDESNDGRHTLGNPKQRSPARGFFVLDRFV